ncbi:retrovirus-related pol polyprotein from transposon tnt 1-94 [Trichonephila clavipes]|nr:retrovirus-related pol polyprotein from transposon tnt 1-94 [Trichonephila clavipes]
MGLERLISFPRSLSPIFGIRIGRCGNGRSATYLTTTKERSEVIDSKLKKPESVDADAQESLKTIAKAQEALIATKSERHKQEGNMCPSQEKKIAAITRKRKGHWSCTSETSLTSYWIDNGATRHVTNCYTYFVDFIKFDSPCGIKAAGNETLAALGKGTTKVKSTINGKMPGSRSKRFISEERVLGCIQKTALQKFRYGYLIKREFRSKKGVRAHASAHTRTLGYSVKEFLCDNGGEFDNKDVHEILHSNGITQRLTAPYTPEQNGASEREMQTTIEMARTLKYSNPEVSFPAAIQG